MLNIDQAHQWMNESFYFSLKHMYFCNEKQLVNTQYMGINGYECIVNVIAVYNFLCYVFNKEGPLVFVKMNWNDNVILMEKNPPP